MHGQPPAGDLAGLGQRDFQDVEGGVLVPTFRQAKNDDRARGMLRELFPGREITGIDCLDLVEEGGTLHCISQQQPA